MTAPARRGSGRTTDPRLGRVTAYDAARGLGTVEEEGGGVFSFHATAIADGTRTIEVEAAVAFAVVPRLGGRFEASAVTPLSRSGTDLPRP